MSWESLQLSKGDVSRFIKGFEPPIERLILLMNALPFLRTYLSCSGHIEREKLYHTGIFFYIDENNQKAKRFIKEFNELIEGDFEFVRLIPLDFEIVGHPMYKIEMDCLTYPLEYKERQKDYYEETYGKLHLAIEQLVNRWLKFTGREAIARKWLKEIS